VINVKKLVLFVIYIAIIFMIGIILFVVFASAKEDELLKSQMGGTLTENQFFLVPDRIIYKNSKNEYFIITPSDSEFDIIFTEISNRIESVKDGEVLDDKTIANIKQEGSFVELDYNTKSKNRIFPLEQENIAMINMFDKGGQVKKTSISEKEKLIKKLDKITKRLDTYEFEKNNYFISNSKLINIPQYLDFKEKDTGIYQLVITNEEDYGAALQYTNYENSTRVNFLKENVVMTISKYEINSIEENVGNIKYQFSYKLDSYKVSVLIVSKVVNVNCIYIEGNKVSPDNDLEKIEANTILICEKEVVKKEIKKYIKDTYRIDGLSIEHIDVNQSGNGYIILVAGYENFIYPIKLNVNTETETYLGMGYHLQSNYGYILHEMNDITLDTKITDIDNVQGYVKMIEYIAD